MPKETTARIVDEGFRAQRRERAYSDPATLELLKDVEIAADVE